jgi:transposase
VRTFGTTPAALLPLADGLTGEAVTPVALARTGGLGTPVFNLREGRCEGILVNAQHYKAVPGRKTGVKDCAWLAPLLAPGLRRARFIPPCPIRARRALPRSRETLSQAHTREATRVQKLLASAKLKWGLVATASLGASGRAILRALVAGERAGGVPAQLATGTLRQKRARLAAALTGRFTDHQAARRSEWLAHSEYVEAAIARLRQRIAAVRQPYARHVEPLQSLPGVDRDAAEMRIAEIGAERRRFPSAAHLASWAGICPGTHESAGKRRTGKTRPGNRWLKPWLIECGWGAGRARRTSLGAPYARIGRRRGKEKAALAVGPSILVAAYYMLRDGVPYHAWGPEPCAHLATERLTRHDVQRLEQRGHHVTREQGTDVA